MFSLTAAVATAQFAVYQYLHGATVGFFGFEALLSGLVFIATLLLFMALVQNRLYFVYVARQLNAIRGYLMEVEAAGFKNNKMYTSFDFPALKPFSVHTFTLIGAALISSLFAGISAYSVSPALGGERCEAVGVITFIAVFVGEAGVGIWYLSASGRRTGDQAVHRAKKPSQS
jgi:hypothetical protein